VRLLLIVAAALGAVLAPSTALGQAAPPAVVVPGAPDEQVAAGRALFVEGCASCHGQDARGTERAPDLHGVGELSADFYLRTGRMPLAVPGEEPKRTDPLYSDEEIEALVAYVGSLGGGSSRCSAPAVTESSPRAAPSRAQSRPRSTSRRRSRWPRRSASAPTSCRGSTRS
jgi:mono/diheme cytochrome c family protein